MNDEDAEKRSAEAHGEIAPTRSHQTLGQLLAVLTAGPQTALPAAETWPELIDRITTEGVVQEVSEETFDYFLDVLPPKYMGRACFAFAEGAEPFRFFWKQGGKFFCRRLSWPETQEFCRLARGGDHVS